MRSPSSYNVNGVDLRCVAEGSGSPLVFVHGGLDDYRYWLPFMDVPGYRCVTYSRRYNYPNGPSPSLPDYSALTDAGDLEGLVAHLGLSKVTLVGESYGALASLIYAMKHRDSVEAMVLCEPPIVGWLETLPGGREAKLDFERRFWSPLTEAFRRGDGEAAISCALDYFVGPGAVGSLPKDVVEDARSNAREWEVLTASSEPFPHLEPTEVESLRVRSLVMTGERTLPPHAIIDRELEKRLYGSRSVSIPGASHDMWKDNPDACRAALKDFLD
jgi:pimeloyl-ACP methyl ester carboxylesterase